jgi:hypothetical protein
MPTITDITNRNVVTNKDAKLWDLSFNAWAEAKSVSVIPKGTVVEVSAIAKHKLGGTYYMTEYSFSKGIMNGINEKDCDEIPTTPVVPPVTPPVDPPVVQPPIVTPPEPEYPNWFKDFWLKLIDAIKNILNKG